MNETQKRSRRTPPVEAADFKRQVGLYTHRVIADLAALEERAAGYSLIDLCWQLTTRLVANGSLGSRTRAARLMVASAAAVYGHYFLPPASWRLAGCEVEIGEDSRIDLVWQHEDGTVLYDEIKLSAAFGRPIGEGPTQRQVARYAAHGRAMHGDSFAGVRLILLGAPRHSMLVGPGPRLQRLVESPHWLETREASR